MFAGKEFAETASQGEHVVGAPFWGRELGLGATVVTLQQLGGHVIQMPVILRRFELAVGKFPAFIEVADFGEKFLISFRVFDEEIVGFQIAMSDRIVSRAQSVHSLEDLFSEIDQSALVRLSVSQRQHVITFYDVQESGVASFHDDQPLFLTSFDDDAVDKLDESFPADKLPHHRQLVLEFANVFRRIEMNLFDGHGFGPAANGA